MENIGEFLLVKKKIPTFKGKSIHLEGKKKIL
jgi:hypothetical protein